jgi:hypothetical protein
MIAPRDVFETEPPAAASPDSPARGHANSASASPESTPQADDESLYLIGRPTLKQYLQFIAREAVEPAEEAVLIKEWQDAKDYVGILEKSEAGQADKPSIVPIDVQGKYRPLLVDFLKDPLVQNGFNTVPSGVAFVELDNMVVYQHHIDLTFVRRLQEKLGPTPTEEEVFRTCLPYDHPHPPAKWSRVEDDTYVFVSPSNDLRFLGNLRLAPGNLKDIAPPGALVGVLGAAVGFGTNFLNAISVEGRLILNNGSHRAYALRQLGLTHLPCIVQHVSTRDELGLVASSAVRRNPDHFLKGPRPSLLKDYFDPKLRKIARVHRRMKQVRIKVQVEESFVPCF